MNTDVTMMTTVEIRIDALQARIDQHDVGEPAATNDAQYHQLKRELTKLEAVEEAVQIVYSYFPPSLTAEQELALARGLAGMLRAAGVHKDDAHTIIREAFARARAEQPDVCARTVDETWALPVEAAQTVFGRVSEIMEDPTDAQEMATLFSQVSQATASCTSNGSNGAQSAATMPQPSTAAKPETDARLIWLERGRAWVRSVGVERAIEALRASVVPWNGQFTFTSWRNVKKTYGGTTERNGEGVIENGTLRDYAIRQGGYSLKVIAKGEGMCVAHGTSRHLGGTDEECLTHTGLLLDQDDDADGTGCIRLQQIFDEIGIAYAGQRRPERGNFHAELPLAQALVVGDDHLAFKSVYRRQLCWVLGVLSEIVYPGGEGKKRFDPKTDRLLQQVYWCSKRTEMEDEPQGFFGTVENKALDWHAFLTATQYPTATAEAEIAGARSRGGTGAEEIKDRPPIEISDKELQSRVKRATKYIGKMPPAISGEDGSGAAWAVALTLVKGFDLPTEVAFDVFMREYNPVCAPPWSEQEARRKIDDAETSQAEWGYLLKEKQAPSAPTAPTTGSSATATVEITTEEGTVNDKIIAALAPRTKLFDYGGALAHVIAADPATDEDADVITRAEGSPKIKIATYASLREEITRHVNLERFDKKEKKMASKHPMEWMMGAILARGYYPGFKQLVAVTDSPVLLPDGTLLTKQGFDATSGILYVPPPGTQIPPIPDEPTVEQAKVALKKLREVVKKFPFKTEAHKDAWVAGVLTPLARPAISGQVPMFLMDASTRGSGKTLLVKIIEAILSGRDRAIMSPTDDEAEWRKRITTCVAAGDTRVCIDNITKPFGGEAIDSALTTPRWQDRLLATNVRIDLPMLIVFYATGNNVQIIGDLVRRLVHVRLESEEEHPEERAFPDDIVDETKRNRGELLGQALTILRGYCAAGRPDQKLVPWGNPFDQWSKIVQNAIHWAGGCDIGLTRKGLREESDREGELLGDLLAGLLEIAPKLGSVFTASKLMIELTRSMAVEHQRLRAALGELVRTQPSKLPEPAQVGSLFRRHRNRVVNGMAIVRGSSDHGGSATWSVKISSAPKP